MRIVLFATCVLALVFSPGCGGGGSSASTASASVNLSLGALSMTLFPGDPQQTVTFTAAATGSPGAITVSVIGLPNGVSAQITQPDATGNGSIIFNVTTNTAAGNILLTIQAATPSAATTQTFTLNVGALTKVTGVKTGSMNLALSTSFQPAEWDYRFFQQYPGALTPLNNLNSAHIRLQGVSQGIPQKSAASWDFAMLDAIAQPVLTVTDHSPEFQIAAGPSFMYDPVTQKLRDLTYAEFATYSVNLVRYYNNGGFTSSDGVAHVSAGKFPIQYWGIYNEPNINNVTASEYVTLYNKVVPAMQAIDPSLRFAAVELADFGQEEQAFIPPFVKGVTAQVDVLATHFYSSCNQKDTDQAVFNTIPSFANGVIYIYAQLQTNPKLAAVPVWVTENNVNADFSDGKGTSVCNPGQPFVVDKRGSSGFFTAWRPTVFSQLAKAGAQALYHWDYPSDAQYGEFNANTGALQLSYWVDYWVPRYFPARPLAILQIQPSLPELEVLAAKAADGTVSVLVANHAVANASDNNGAGAPRSFALDIAPLGAFTTATQVEINAATDTVNGPVEKTITPNGRLTYNFSGYGMVMYKLQ